MSKGSVMISRVLAAELPSRIGERVRIAGWPHRRRQLKSVTFLVVRDRSGLAQVVLTEPGEALTEETVVHVEGVVTASPRAPRGVEITAPVVTPLSERAAPPPFDLYRPAPAATLPTILDGAPVTLRHPRLRAPFERVYEVGPVFRAEPHDTARHLAQYTSLDAEFGFVEDHRDVMALLRDVVAGMAAAVAERAPAAVGLLGRDMPEVPETIPGIHFADAQELLAERTGAGGAARRLPPAGGRPRRSAAQARARLGGRGRLPPLPRPSPRRGVRRHRLTWSVTVTGHGE